MNTYWNVYSEKNIGGHFLLLEKSINSKFELHEMKNYIYRNECILNISSY